MLHIRCLTTFWIHLWERLKGNFLINFKSLQILLFSAWKVSVFGVILVRIFPYSVQMWENTDQNNSEYGLFLRSGLHTDMLINEKFDKKKEQRTAQADICHNYVWCITYIYHPKY